VAIFLRRALPIVAGLAFLVLVIAWLAGSFEEKISPGRVDMAQPTLAGRPTENVHEVTKDYTEEALGTLKAASRTVISARLLATILEIPVTAGSQVEEGDLLVRLRDDEYRSRLQQAQQALAAATANRLDAESDLARNQTLFEQNATSKATLENSSRQAVVAKAEELRAQQAVEEASILLSYTTIKAPKSGRIVDRLAEPGDTASPGEPLLVLYDARSLRLEAPVLEELAVKLRVGQELEVYIDALKRELRATVDEIVPQADAPSRSFLVKATLPESEDLYEGMFGRLRIPAGTRRHLCLATDAIQRIGQLRFVDVVLDNGTVERRLVEIGQLGMPGRVEVLSGLRAGERVILHSTRESRGSSAEDE
jgi:RND family efflux transporter MFP subunit